LLAGTLANLAGGNVSITAAVVAADAIPPIAELLRSGSDEDKGIAAQALEGLADNNDANKAAGMAAGAILPMVELLRGGSDEAV